MKKNLYFSTATILFLILTMLFSACSGNFYIGTRPPFEFGSNAQNIYVHSTSSQSLSFSVALLSTKKIKKITCVGLEGTQPSLDDFDVTIIDNNTRSMNRHTHNGLHMKYILVEISPKSDVGSCEFQTLVLNVDGVTRRLHFNTPIKHTFSAGTVFTEALQLSIIPVEFSSRFINNTESRPTYIFYANEDVTLERIRLDDFLTVADVKYAIGNEEPQFAQFPISIKKGETICLDFSFASTNANGMSYVTTNIYFDYITDSDNTSHFNSAVVVFDPIFPLTGNGHDEIDALIESVQ